MIVEKEPAQVLSSVNPESILETVGGCRETARKLLNLFINDLINFETDMEKAYQGKDRDELIHVVHTLGGLSSCYRAPILMELTKNLEILLKSGAPVEGEEIDSLCRELLAEVKFVNKNRQILKDYDL